MEIVVNRCFGGFGLSYKAVMRYAELIGKNIYAYASDGNSSSSKCRQIFEDDSYCTHYLTEPNLTKFPEDNDLYFSERNIMRNDENLVKVVKELGEEANTRFSHLEIVEIPDDVDWEISEYDGMETVEEKHRSW
jgi:hypothetical protein